MSKDKNFWKSFWGTYKVIMQDKQISIESKGIYAYLLSRSGDKQKCFPSLKLICNELGISENRYSKYMRELIKKGYLTKSYEYQGGKRSKRYFNFPKQDDKELTLQNDQLVNSLTLQNKELVTTQNKELVTLQIKESYNKNNLISKENNNKEINKEIDSLNVDNNIKLFLKELLGIKNYPFDLDKDRKLIEELMTKYPLANVKRVLRYITDIYAEGIKGKEKPRMKIRTAFRFQQERAEEKIEREKQKQKYSPIAIGVKSEDTDEIPF